MSTQAPANDIVTLRNVRLSFPQLFSPQMETDDNGNPKPDGKLKFSATFLLNKKTNAKDIAAMNAAIAAVKKSPKLAGDKRVPKVFFRDGSEKVESFNVHHQPNSVFGTLGATDPAMKPVGLQIDGGRRVAVVVEWTPDLVPASVADP